MKTCLYLLASMLSLTLAGCRWIPMNVIQGSGVKVVESRSVGSFDAVVIGGSTALEIRQGDQVTLTIEGDDNIVPIINTRVDGSTLDIYAASNYVSTKPIIVRVTVPTLRAMKVHGSGDVDLGGFTIDEFDVAVSGSGHVGGQCTIRTLKANVSGSGNIDARNCTVSTANCSISGSGQVQLPAIESLKAVVSGSGNVEYRGTPQLEQTISGSGSVHQVK